MLIFPAVAQTYSVFSPDGKVAFELSVFEKLTMSVYFKGKPIIQNSEFGLQFEQSVYLGTDMVVVSQNQAEVNEFWKPVIGQYTQVHNHAN